MESLISELIEQGYLKTPRIIRAFKKIDRADFVLPEFKNSAYLNVPLPIGHGQTISQPLTVAFMFELLQPEVGDKILDIGSGSGWTTALLAEIMSKMGKVFSIEIVPELCEFGEGNVRKYFSVSSQHASPPSVIPRLDRGIQRKNQKNFLDSPVKPGDDNRVKNSEVRIEFLCLDGSRGYSPEAPYDKILVSAAAAKIPRGLKNQLKIKGRLVIPVRNSIWLVERTAKNKFREKEFYGFTFVPLKNREFRA